MKTIAALMSAACLCAPVAAQAQTQNATTPATAPKTPSPSAAQPGGKPTRIGGAPGANVQALSGDSEGCPRGPNGEEECTVEVSGSSNRGGSGGGSLGSGGSGLGGPPSCGSRKVLQAQECTPDTPGGTGPDPEEEREKKIQACDKEYGEQKAAADQVLAKSLDVCVELSKNPLTYAYDQLKKPWRGDCLTEAQTTFGKSYDNARILREVCYRRAKGG